MSPKWMCTNKSDGYVILVFIVSTLVSRTRLHTSCEWNHDWRLILLTQAGVAQVGA
jgi:hypothetical protein